jgi:carbon storage regulator CsrA
MLVLRRKVGESIAIGDGVVVRVLAVRGRSVRLGIQAPTSQAVWRQELCGTRGYGAGGAASISPAGNGQG